MTKAIAGSFLAVLVLLGSSAGMAAQVVLVNAIVNPPTVTQIGPSTYNVLGGQQFQVKLAMTGGTNIGGGTISMTWDPSKANYVSGSLPSSGPVGTGTGSFLVVHLPSFDLLPGAPPVNGNFDFAFFTFQATTSLGAMNLQIFENLANFDGWFDNTTAEPIPTSYQQANIYITPVPAAVWLLGSAVGLLGWIRRKALFGS